MDLCGPYTDTAPARLASYCCSRTGFDHYRRSSRIASHSDHRDELCTIAAQEDANLLHQSSEVILRSELLAGNAAKSFRVNVGGKLDTVCFDKTGTLTEEGLDVLGVRVVHRPGMRYTGSISPFDAPLSKQTNVPVGSVISLTIHHRYCLALVMNEILQLTISFTKRHCIQWLLAIPCARSAASFLAIRWT